MKDSFLLKIKNGSFGYYSGFIFHPIISNVNIEVKTGDFLILEGPNGSGKSTLIKAILNLGATFKGDIQFFIPLQNIGYIPQEIKIDTIAPFSVMDIIKSAFPFNKISKDKIIEALNIVEMGEKSNFRFGLLSGGEKRRILLARALACDANLIILDEPIAGIDKENKNKLEKVLYSLVSTQHKAILATTHSSDWCLNAKRYLIKEQIKC